MREYIISKVKRPLMKAIITLSKRYPEPTREECRDHNTLILMDMRDEFLRHEDNSGRIELFKALFRMFIAEYAHDKYYKFRIDWLKFRLEQAHWVYPQTWASSHWRQWV
jgi:hypothetical protein